MKKTDYEYALSIIVPVYNVEKYLDECINSILSQKHQGCEIILVDDGSTDRSGAICDSYAGFPDIKVIHKPNGGSSSARNAGMEAASGKYIAFLDSDDRIAPKSLEYIMEWLAESEVDVCFMEAICFFPDGRIKGLGNNIQKDEIQGKSKQQVFEHLSTRPKFAGSACTSLFRADFIKSNNVRFYEDKILCEDLFFCFDCYMAAESYDALIGPYYEYRQAVEGSKTYEVNTKTFWAMASFIEYVATKTSDNKIPRDGICASALSFAAYEYSIVLWQYARLNRDQRHLARAFLDKYDWLLEYGESKKIKYINYINTVFGINITSIIMNFYMSIRK